MYETITVNSEIKNKVVKEKRYAQTRMHSAIFCIFVQNFEVFQILHDLIAQTMYFLVPFHLAIVQHKKSRGKFHEMLA
jgi:hypothetical protein